MPVRRRPFPSVVLRGFLVVIGLATTAPRVVANPLFAAPFLSFDAGTSPSSVAIGDLNGDGKPDLVIANGPVSVLLGHGDGTFGPKTDLSIGSGSVAIGDLNADGKPDLVAPGVVLLGHGDGTFDVPTGFGTGSSPYSVAIGDVNGDGKPDVVTANFGDSTVSVLLGNGNGTFGLKTDFATGAGPYSVAIGDLNGDAKPDVVTASYGDSMVSVLLGNGDGTFGAKTDFGTGDGPWVAIADLNGDGKPDLATANRDGTFSVLLGVGDGTFGPKTNFGAGSNSFSSVAIGDLNGDGKPDLVSAKDIYFTVTVLFGNGDGTFGTETDFDAGLTPQSVTIGDLNGDGKPDLVTANDLPRAVSVLLGNGDGSFGVKTDFGTGDGPESVAIGDLNGDSKPDLVTANNLLSTDTHSVSVLLGNGNGTFGAKTDFGTDGPSSVAIGDLNGDGKPDLVTANGGADGTASVLLGNGDGTFGPKTDFGTGIRPHSVAIGDLNGDGKPDLVTANYGGSTVSVLLGNGDGKPDLVTANYLISTSTNSVSVLLGDGNGTFGAKTDFGTGDSPSAVAIGDLNGDGKPDLATANIGDGTVSVLLGNGNGTFGPKSDFSTGSGPIHPRSVAIGDLNGDGKPDLVAGKIGTVSVLFGNGDGTFGSKSEFGTGGAGSSEAVAIGDLNGDGKPDLVTANSNTATVSVLLNTGDRNTATLLAEFEATTTADGIELRWMFGDPSRVRTVAVERAVDTAGPWLSIAPELHEEAGVTVALDRATEGGRAYFYRLVVQLTDGGWVVFGPVSASHLGPPSMSALTLVSPNPTSGHTQVDYEVARTGRVQLEVLDVSGRVEETLADRIQTPGRYVVAWDEAGPRGRLAPGLYFIRLVAPDRVAVKKLAAIR